MTTSEPATMAQASTNQRPITVFESTESYNIKHPLQYGWSLWLKKQDSHGHGHRDSRGGAGGDHGKQVAAGDGQPKSSMQTWIESVDHIGTFHTVEDFWCVVNNIPSVMQLQNQSDYFFFREGIAPMWEDEANVGGGQFQITVAPMPSAGSRDGPGAAGGPRKVLDWDGLWLNAMLAAVGCFLEHHDLINGINFGKRSRGDRIQVWMRPTTPEQRAKIEAGLVEALLVGLPPATRTNWTLKYSNFDLGGGSHGGPRRDAGRRH